MRLASWNVISSIYILLLAFSHLRTDFVVSIFSFWNKLHFLLCIYWMSSAFIFCNLPSILFICIIFLCRYFRLSKIMCSRNVYCIYSTTAVHCLCIVYHSSYVMMLGILYGGCSTISWHIWNIEKQWIKHIPLLKIQQYLWFIHYVFHYQLWWFSAYILCKSCVKHVS